MAQRLRRHRRMGRCVVVALSIMVVACGRDHRAELFPELEMEIGQILAEMSPGMRPAVSIAAVTDESEFERVRTLGFELREADAEEFGNRVCARVRQHLAIRLRRLGENSGGPNRSRENGSREPGYLHSTFCHFRMSTGGRMTRVLIHVVAPEGGGWSSVHITRIEYG